MTRFEVDVEVRNMHDGTIEFTQGDRQRRDLLAAMISEAAFDGWTDDALDQAARDEGFSTSEIKRGDVRLLFPKTISDVLDFWAREEDRQMIEAFKALENPPAKIREKITWLVRQRISQLIPNKESARRAAATLALPLHAGAFSRQAWRTAGAMWRALGDTSTDGNFYSKRATLSAVYLSTLMHWFSDNGSEDFDDPYQKTWDYLDRRIDGVMQLEKFKAQTKNKGFDVEALAGVFGRMRYGR